ncbi:MAG: ABC transporter permease [Acetivibrio ethanolgignens]
MKNPIMIVMNKELTRVFSDKKMVFSLFIMPAILMVGIYSFMGKAMNNMMDDIKEHVAKIYVENAPEGFSDFIGQSGIIADIQYAKDESGEEVKNMIFDGTLDLYVVFEENFLNKVADYQNGSEVPELKTYYNPSEDYSNEARDKFLKLVAEPYRQALLAERIGDLNSLAIFVIDKDPASSVIMDESKASGKMMGMLLPYLIVILLFTGPMSLGIDAITGEKERGTLASMLVSPVKRSQIVLGKLLSLSILSCLSAIVYAGSIAFSLPKLYKGMEESGMTMKVTPLQILMLLVIMLALVYLYVSVVGAICVFAKNAKEAGTYVSPAYIVVLVAGVLTMFAGNKETALGMFAIPVYGSATAIQKLLVNELTMAQFGLAVGGSLLAAVIFTAIITKAFNSEKVMLNA